MPRSAKLVFAVFVLWAAAYATLTLYGDFALSASTDADQDASRFFDHALIYCNAAVALAVLIIEIYLAFSLDGIHVADRVLWAFGLIFFFPLTAPAFWYLHVWRRPPRPLAR